jgi:hypothetical protein
MHVKHEAHLTVKILHPHFSYCDGWKVYLYILVTHEVKAAFTSNKKHAARKQQAAVSLLLIHLLQ